LLVVGAILWGLYRVARPVPPDSVVVSAQRVEALADRFEAQHDRRPSEDELDATIDEWVTREILLREARRQGLARADPIVDRRLVQKMRFALEDAEARTDPGDVDLEAWMLERADAYRRPPRRGFAQVFVAGVDAQARARAEGLAEQLRAGADAGTLGDAFPHGGRQPPAGRDALEDRYGAAFAQLVFAAPRDRWILAESAFGWHVLRVDREHPGELPPLSDVRARVLADWRVEQRSSALTRGVDALRERYEVRVER